MDLETKLDLIKKSPTEEVITEDSLRNLLETNLHPQHYIGFEISGLLHLGTLIMCGFKINDFIKAGIKCKVFLADWHSFINDKLGGDWERILKAAKYFEEGFKFFCPNVETVLGSELYHNNDQYWKDLVKFSKQISLARDTRCLTIMGRSENEKLDFAQYLYPPMQAVDVKYNGPELPHGGMDQRKVHVLAKDVFPKLKWKVPVPVHHHLLMGLAKPEDPKSQDKLDQVVSAKMSKSKPWTAIFVHDTEKIIKEKLNKAWCPERVVEMNPVIELAKYIVFHETEQFTIERSKNFGGHVTFNSYS